MAAALSITILVVEGCDGKDEREVRAVRESVPVERTDKVSVLRLFARLEGLDNAVPTLAPTPAPTEIPVSTVRAYNDVEAAICAAGWPEEWGGCAKALRVAQCESTDYFAPFDGNHAGAFQISYIHAGIFAVYGYDYWVDGDNPAASALVALFLLRGANGYWPRHWPTCGYR